MYGKKITAIITWAKLRVVHGFGIFCGLQILHGPKALHGARKLRCLGLGWLGNHMAIKFIQVCVSAFIRAIIHVVNYSIHGVA